MSDLISNPSSPFTGLAAIDWGLALQRGFVGAVVGGVAAVIYYVFVLRNKNK
ncbi:MAG: hypothetical protein WD768_20990 [Phycisphaeraceae bacterium]